MVMIETSSLRATSTTSQFGRANRTTALLLRENRNNRVRAKSKSPSSHRVTIPYTALG
jgi:hypothetical protein